VASIFFFVFGGSSLSLCFCGILHVARFLLLSCLLGFVSTQSGGEGGFGRWEGGVWGGAKPGNGNVGVPTRASPHSVEVHHPLLNMQRFNLSYRELGHRPYTIVRRS